MKFMSNLEIGQMTPRKISAQLCQVRWMTMVSVNVCNGSAGKFAIRQKCA